MRPPSAMGGSLLHSSNVTVAMWNPEPANPGGAPGQPAKCLETFAAPVPLIGSYSGVEIAPVNGRSRSLDWIAVLTVLHRRG